MGFRDYAPGLNWFTTRDMYNGSLANMSLGADPYTGNRYAFTAGNPISRIEIDGHLPCAEGIADTCGSATLLQAAMGGSVDTDDGASAGGLLAAAGAAGISGSQLSRLQNPRMSMPIYGKFPQVGQTTLCAIVYPIKGSCSEDGDHR